MIIFRILTLIICIFVMLICWNYLVDKDNNKNKYAFGLCVSCGIMLLTMLSIVLKYGADSQPNVIDVYRGKTDLKIVRQIVNDSIIRCDSIVVFKDNMK